uniref:Uncharacterized protein n=1 Tax=viral metagenome TaxID=1070528 RepID=A0A6C0JKT6_9ZZZZ
MRNLGKKEKLYIPLDDYPTDSALKEYLVEDILDLAENYTRNVGRKVITEKDIKYIITPFYISNADFYIEQII